MPLELYYSHILMDGEEKDAEYHHHEDTRLYQPSLAHTRIPFGYTSTANPRQYFMNMGSSM